MTVAGPSKSAMITAIGFDADDTLWHNESLYHLTQEKYRTLLAPYHAPEWIDRKLYETEMRNLQRFGYGIKGFTLSMIETAVELSEGRVRGDEIGQILDFAKEMMAAPVELLPCVRETLTALSRRFRLLLITKGDLFDQETKLARSGLAHLFDAVEVLSEKHAPAYQAVLAKHSLVPSRFLMVGNSARSDILPVTELGARAVHIPYAITWQHEEAEPGATVKGVYALASMCELLPLLEQLGQPAFAPRK